MLAKPNLYVQLGAARDGIEPYLECAKRRRFQSLLIDTSDHLDFRKRLMRDPFDQEIGLKSISDFKEILKNLKNSIGEIRLILPGYEPYVSMAHKTSQFFNVPIANDLHLIEFKPLDKSKQRNLLKRNAPSILQPKHGIASKLLLEKMQNVFDYPLVVKPVNGSGGLGVYMVHNRPELLKSISMINKLSNYNGSVFDKILIEEYIFGVEMSVQGICKEGTATVLGFCEKIMKHEQTLEDQNIKWLRETGYIAQSGVHLPQYLQDFIQKTTSTLNYHNGPFHIDFIVNRNGPYFIKMGFGLSKGTVVELIDKTCDIDWAELSFSNYLKEKSKKIDIQPKFSFNAIGLATIQSKATLCTILKLKEHGNKLDIQMMNNIVKLQNKNTLQKNITADFSIQDTSLAKVWVKGENYIQTTNLIKDCLGIS